MKVSLISFCLGIVLVGCFAKKITNELSVDSAYEKLKKEYPEYSEVDYNQGKMLYEQTCNTCHGFKDPSKYSSEELKAIVPNMVRKSNQKKGTSLTALDSDLIYKYILAIKP